MQIICTKDYGGISMLWPKRVGVTSISDISSGRICYTRFIVDDAHSSVVSIIGMYLSYLDQGMDNYREHLVQQSG